MKNKYNIGDLFMGKTTKFDDKRPLFKQGYIYGIEKIKRTTRYLIRWEPSQHTPHYLPLEGVYCDSDIKSFIEEKYIYLPVKT